MTNFYANENSKLCNDCGHWAECPECGVCGLCRLYDPPSEQRTYCLKHYRQTFPDKGCDMCEMEARIKRLSTVNKTLQDTVNKDSETIARQAMTIHKLMTRGDRDVEPTP